MLDAAEAAPGEPPSPAVEAGDVRAVPPTPLSGSSTTRIAPTTAPSSEDASPAEPVSATTWWLTDRDLQVFAVLSAVLLALLACRWAELSGWGAHEIEIERQTPLAFNFQLDPNTANWVELAQLDGVGETLALRIVEDRETNGPFRTLDDLDRVKGIGAKTLERLRPYLHIAQIDDAQK